MRAQCYRAGKKGGWGQPFLSGRLTCCPGGIARIPGIVNFFAAADPLLAIGSVIRAGEPALYHWRYYLGQEPAVGVAPDMRSAENHLLTRHREYLLTPDAGGR